MSRREESMPNVTETAMQAARTEVSNAIGGFIRFTNLTEAMDFASFIAKSDLVPTAFRNKPADIVICMQLGMELGFSPLQALQMIAVINGKPGIYGDAIPALLMGDPSVTDIVEVEPKGTDEKAWVATCTITRKGRSPVSRSFSYEDAKKAGLWGKAGPWSQYPKRMLLMRARSFASRDACADILRGVKMAEELQDYQTPVVVERAEPRRLAMTLDTTPAHSAHEPADVRNVPDVPKPSLPANETATGLYVLDYQHTKDAKGGYYVVMTNDGEFVLRDQALADSLKDIKDTDHTFTATYRRAELKTGVVRVLTGATVDRVAGSDDDEGEVVA